MSVCAERWSDCVSLCWRSLVHIAGTRAQSRACACMEKQHRNTQLWLIIFIYLHKTMFTYWRQCKEAEEHPSTRDVVWWGWGGVGGSVHRQVMGGDLKVHQRDLNGGNNRLTSGVNAVRGGGGGGGCPGGHPCPDTVSNPWPAILEQRETSFPQQNPFTFSKTQLRLVTVGNGVTSTRLGSSQSDWGSAKKVNHHWIKISSNSVSWTLSFSFPLTSR